MRLLKLSVGIYMGEHIEIFYDMPSSKEAVSIMKVPLEIDNKLGAKFIDKFLKDNFSRESIVDFCEERIQEIQRQNSLNEIKESLIADAQTQIAESKESLIADAQTQIAESLKPYLMDKYGGSFSEEEIKGMLATMRFTASADANHVEPKVVIPKYQSKPKSNLIKCFIFRNADAQGLFNPTDQTLTVIKGSRINPVHVRKISEAGRKKRDRLFAEYTEVQDGKRIVNVDVIFDTPSGAAQFCVGGSANGWNEWKDEKGRELNVYRVNDGTHKTGGSFDTNRIADPHQFQLDFWTKFKAKLEATGKIPTLQTPQPHNWYDVRIGRSNILLNNVCNTQKNFVGVKLYIRNQVADIYYPALEARRNEINLALGSEPEWDANPSAKDKTIALFHKTDLSDSQNVDEALKWLVEQTIIFYRVFSEEVKDIKV